MVLISYLMFDEKLENVRLRLRLHMVGAHLSAAAFGFAVCRVWVVLSL